MLSRLSIEEKARIDFEDYTRMRAKLRAKLSDEQRKEIEEDEKQHPEDMMTLRKYEQQFKEAHTFIDELRKENYFQSLGGVDVYDLFIDTMRNPETNFHSDGFRDSRVVNLSSSPYLTWFLDVGLDKFFYRNLQFRCASNKRLDHVVRDGTDREDRKTYVSPHSAKALEYGAMPKLLLVYDGEGIRYFGGVEGYEHEFTKDPKSLLQCAVRIHLQD